MTTTPGQARSASLQRIIDKSQARRAASAMLEDSGLTVRARKNELVITNPSDPERGRIYVEYANGYVSWERTVWDYWGPLQGYADEDDTTGPGVGPDRILEALTGRTHKAGYAP